MCIKFRFGASLTLMAVAWRLLSLAVAIIVGRMRVLAGLLVRTTHTVQVRHFGFVVIISTIPACRRVRRTERALRSASIFVALLTACRVQVAIGV